MTTTVEHLCDAADQALDFGNWYAALAVALTLPDIAASICAPNGRSSAKKYAAWFDEHLRQNYVVEGGPASDEIVFLDGADCYALRCAWLHQGSLSIENERVRKVLSRFRFEVVLGGDVHRNLNKDGSLQLDVEKFVREITSAVRLWLAESERDEERRSRLANMGKIGLLGLRSGIGSIG